jgi:dTDP-D-glucose 4,6-dehydratase
MKGIVLGVLCLFPEKLIPHMIVSMLEGKTPPVYGTQTRKGAHRS